MFFKRKLPVSVYCTTRLELLLGQEQTNLLLAAKRSWDDPAITRAGDDAYLYHMRAAHIELMLIVIAHKSSFGRRSWDFLREASAFTESYLERHGQGALNGLRDIYNRAFGSSAATPIDGLLLMAASLAQNICDQECAQSTITRLHAILHVGCESYASDFKQVKLVSSNASGE